MSQELPDEQRKIGKYFGVLGYTLSDGGEVPHSSVYYVYKGKHVKETALRDGLFIDKKFLRKLVEPLVSMGYEIENVKKDFHPEMMFALMKDGKGFTIGNSNSNRIRVMNFSSTNPKEMRELVVQLEKTMEAYSE